jgi:hypothetical protein
MHILQQWKGTENSVGIHGVQAITRAAVLFLFFPGHRSIESGPEWA